MPWYIYALAGAVIISASHLYRRRTMIGKQKLDFYTSSYLFSLTSTLALAIYVMINGFEMPPIIDLWPIVLINLVAGTVAWLTNNKGLSLIGLGEFSILLIPIRQIVTWLASLVFLGIGLSLVQGLGAIIILMGIVVVYAGKESFRQNNIVGVFFTVITAVIYGLAFLTDQVIYRQSDVASYMLIGFSVMTLTIGLIRPSVFNKTRLILKPKYRLNLIGSGVLFTFGLALVFYSLKIADNAPLVTALSQLQVIFSVLLGMIFLNERKHLSRKLAGATMATIGAALVVIA